MVYPSKTSHEVQFVCLVTDCVWFVTYSYSRNINKKFKLYLKNHLMINGLWQDLLPLYYRQFCFRDGRTLNGRLHWHCLVSVDKRLGERRKKELSGALTYRVKKDTTTNRYLDSTPAFSHFLSLHVIKPGPIMHKGCTVTKRREGNGRTIYFCGPVWTYGVRCLQSEIRTYWHTSSRGRSRVTTVVPSLSMLTLLIGDDIMRQF